MKRRTLLIVKWAGAAVAAAVDSSNHRRPRHGLSALLLSFPPRLDVSRVETTTFASLPP
jgi:hypothetical protein